MNEAVPPGAIRKTLKRRHLFTLGVGTIVGVAWLMVLGTVLASAGPLGATIGFVVGAGAMIPIGLCYAELSGSMPHAGGEIVYAYQLFGVRWAYVAGICLAFIYIINCVFFAVSVGWLLNELIPGIEGPALYSVLGAAVHVGDLAIGTLVSLALLAAHWRGAKDAARLQDIATYTLLIATCVFVAIGVGRGHGANLRPLIASSDWAWGYGGIFSALAVTPYFFGGFNTIPQAVAELENPEDRRRIASVLAGCILASLLFYCLVLVAVSMVLPREQLLSFELPVAQAFRVAFRSELITDLVLVGGLLGLIAVWNALFFAATRVLYALGRSHLVHPSVGRLSAGAAAPTRAIVFVTALSIAGLFIGKGVLLPVVNVTSTLFAVMYAIVSFGVLHHRRAPGVSSRGYRVPGGQVLVWGAAAFSIYLVVLSLIQQRMDAGGRLPPEWLLLVGLGASGCALWAGSASSRGELSDAERRRIILEEGA
jgi:APA family basic amino acid/polyamine antiporter